jgi:hypothetical protein
MKLNKNIKIEIHSPEHSAAIQKRIFELGCKWLSRSPKYCNIKAPYLFVNNREMHWTDNVDIFSKSSYTQATLDDLYNPSFLTNDSCNGKTVEIDGKRYKLVLEE